MKDWWLDFWSWLVDRALPVRLTPLVRVVDLDDLNYLHSRVQTDLATVRDLLRRKPTDPATLEEIEKELVRLSRLRFSWNVPTAWSAYGAVRRRLLALLPDSAWQAALAELRIMERLVLAPSDAWKALADKTDKLIHDTYPESKEDEKLADEISFNLQELWHEVDFARSYRAYRLAKFESITNLNWALLAVTILGIAYWLPRGNVSVKLLVLFGLLGGAVSALQASHAIVSLETGRVTQETINLRLRPMLGAMAALVFYAIGQSGLLFSFGQTKTGGPPIALLVSTEAVPYVYYVLAFLGGFSERFFMRAISQVEERFPPSERTPAVPK